MALVLPLFEMIGIFGALLIFLDMIVSKCILAISCFILPFVFCELVTDITHLLFWKTPVVICCGNCLP